MKLHFIVLFLILFILNKISSNETNEQENNSNNNNIHDHDHDIQQKQQDSCEGQLSQSCLLNKEDNNRQNNEDSDQIIQKQIPPSSSEKPKDTLSSQERWDSIPTSKYTRFTDPLLSDKYQYEVAYSFFLANKHMDPAVFELYFRSAPFGGQFAVFAGVEEVMSFFKYFKITESHIAFLKSVLPSTQEDESFYDWLRSLGPNQIKVSCQTEGSIVFPKEPLISIEGPLGLIKLLEAPMISLTSFPTLVATNAARMRSAVPSQIKLFEYGLRRAQGSGAALLASRSAYLGGFDETSSLLASNRYNIPLSATMSHAFVTSFKSLEEIEEFTFNGIMIKSRTLYFREKLQFMKTSESELAAFLAFAKAFPSNFICLVDSFDSITSGIPNFIVVAFALMDAGYQPFGVRLDSGQLEAISIKARAIIENAGMQVNKNTKDFQIMVSNRIGEKELKEFSQKDHSIDIFAIETELVVAEDQPHLGMVFKLVEIKGVAAMKFSEDAGKSTLPGKKALYRVWVESSKYPIADIIALPDEDILTKSEIDVVVINQTQERYTIIPKKIERINHLVLDKGELVSKINDLEEAKLYLEQQKEILGPKLYDDPKKFMVVVSQNYWNYFQKSALKVLIPKIIH